jgi:HD-like signal output (HDOD) protein/CheY-like chemotaxis protein
MKTLLFVDDEPRVLQGLQRQLHIMRAEWQMNFVESGPKALEFLATTPVDALISDMMMPGMDGAQLLTEVMHHYPNTVRLVFSGHANRDSVLRLVGVAHQYLSKPCNAEDLRGSIARALAMRDLPASERLKQLASRIKCLPSLPASHAQLTEELLKPDSSIERVAEIISKDIGMTSKILQLVNSAFFGLPQPASNVMEAVMHIGLATVQTLVLFTQVFSRFDRVTITEFSIDGITKHCWMTGVMARRIAQAEQRDRKLSDQCFLAGLLHDFGYLILATGLPKQYPRVLKTARNFNLPVWEIEQAELSASHAEIGAYLLGLWGLPAPVIEAVALHHRPSAATVHGFSPLIAVHVADAIANSLVPALPEQTGVEIDRSYLATLGLAERLEVWKECCIHDQAAGF